MDVHSVLRCVIRAAGYVEGFSLCLFSMLVTSTTPLQAPTILVVLYFSEFQKLKPVTVGPVDTEETWKGNVYGMDTDMHPKIAM